MLEAPNITTTSQSLAISSRAKAITMQIPDAITVLQISSYYEGGLDGVVALYQEVADAGTLEAWQFRSNNNTRRWELISNRIYPEFFGAVGDGITDDLIAFNNLFAFVKAKVQIFNSGQSDSTGFFRPGVFSNGAKCYRLTGSVNATGIQGQTGSVLIDLGFSPVLFEPLASGSNGFDFSDCVNVRLQNMRVCGGTAAIPMQTLLLAGRISDNDNAAENDLINVHVKGYCTKAAVYWNASEQCNFTNFDFENQCTDADSFAFASVSANDLGVTSEFVTLSTQGTNNSNNFQSLYKGNFVGYGSTSPVYIGSGGLRNFISIYSKGSGTSAIKVSAEYGSIGGLVLNAFQGEQLLPTIDMDYFMWLTRENALSATHFYNIIIENVAPARYNNGMYLFDHVDDLHNSLLELVPNYADTDTAFAVIPRNDGLVNGDYPRFYNVSLKAIDPAEALIWPLNSLQLWVGGYVGGASISGISNIWSEISEVPRLNYSLVIEGANGRREITRSGITNTLETDTLLLSSNTTGFEVNQKTIIHIIPETGTTDNLASILANTGGTYPLYNGDTVILAVNVLTDVITIKNGTGNIRTKTAADVTLTGYQIVELRYDRVHTCWKQI